MLEIGTKIKNFILEDENGSKISLSDFKGQKMVVYFYPKNNTPGCNNQACTFRDNYHLYEERGIKLIGISKDTKASHTKFREKFNLPFKTYSDEDFEIAKYFGAYGKKKMFGKEYYGMIRSTFIIDENGVLVGVIPKASPNEDAFDVIKIIDELNDKNEKVIK